MDSSAGSEIDLAYHLARASWNKGYATEAAVAVLGHGLGSVGLERVMAVTLPENVGSWRVMEKAGMRREGILRRWIMHPNISPEPRDCFSYRAA